MKPWREVIIPHSDIRKGGFDEAVFAADLSDVIADRGPLEYRDAKTFFRKTYPTEGLKKLLAAVLARLGGTSSGESVIQIQTPFGGGKTHSLIALYHLIQNGTMLKDDETITHILQSIGMSEVPAARRAVFVGTSADPLQGRTPWGEIAAQLDNYEALAEHDRQRRAPGKDLLHHVLGDQPTLILMDEIAEYAVKARDYLDQVMAFFHELTETVKVLPRCVLVATLPSSAPYGEEGERTLNQLQRIFGRVEAIYTPVEGEEVYEVIRRRLFEDAPDPSEVRLTVESYWEMYQKLGEDVPSQVREPAYREKLRRAYPFHPELIDILFERWSTYPSFQRTRGVLRFLAEVVADLDRREHPAPLIQPAHINLNNATIRRELIKHIGNEFEGVIASDIADSNAKAQKVEREMGSEYARFGVATGLATAIFFGSFSGAERKGVSIQRLRLALLRPGIPPAIVGDTLQRLEAELWYLHAEGGLYWFSNQPNLNRIIVEYEEAVKDEQILEELRRRVESIAGTELAVILWPRDSQDIPDTKQLKLAVLSPEHARQSGATLSLARELLGKYGQTFRTYRNTLVLLVIDGNGLDALKRKVKRYLCLRAIRDDKALQRQLSEENRKTLEGKLKDSEGGVDFELLSAYRHLARAGAEEVKWMDLGLPTIGEKARLARRVRDYLQQEEYLLNKIAPKWLLDKALREDEEEKPVKEIVEAFRRYPHLPMVENDSVVLKAIQQGVQDGLFGVRLGDRMFFQETVPLSESDSEAVLVRKDKIPPPPPPPITLLDVLNCLRSDAEQTIQSVYTTLRQQHHERFPTELEFQEAFRRALLDGRQQGYYQIEPSPATLNWSELLTQGRITKKEGGTPPPPPPPPPPPRLYRLHVRLPWNKLADFVRGVVLPLQRESDELTIEVHLQSHTKAGAFLEKTAETVRETLGQIGAQIIEESWNEE